METQSEAEILEIFEEILNEAALKLKMLDTKVKSWSLATNFKSGKCRAEVHKGCKVD